MHHQFGELTEQGSGFFAKERESEMAWVSNTQLSAILEGKADKRAAAALKTAGRLAAI